MTNANGTEQVPAVIADRTDLTTPYVAPRNANERLLAAIWATILKRETVGVEDHFLELGGDSLSAVQVVLEMHKQFGIEIPAWSVLAQPTVAALAGGVLR
jgi:acyl carrier protein